MQSSQIETALQRIGFATLYWNRVETAWASLFVAVLPDVSESSRGVLLGRRSTLSGRRSLTVRLASERWAVGSEARETIRGLGDRTDELAKQRDAMLAASNIGVIDGTDGVAELVFTDAPRRVDRKRDSIVSAVDFHIEGLRELLAATVAFARSIEPAGSRPQVPDRLIELVVQHLNETGDVSTT